MTARPRPQAAAPIERATLIRIARDTAASRMAARPSLLSAYLTGSVAAGEPMLGDATDIDLVLIDSDDPPLEREIVRLTDQVALDILHRRREDYANARQLRVHPWRGPELAAPLFLHDPTHFFELVQASARGQFHRAENVAARARALVAAARAELHVGLLPGAEPEQPVTLASLGQAMQAAAQAVISLTAFPAGNRRLALRLDVAARALGRPELYTHWLALVGGDRVSAEQVLAWLADWLAAYRAGQSAADELIHPARRTIYERGFRALLAADRPADCLWLLLGTWAELMRHVPTMGEHQARWAAFLQALGLAGAPPALEPPAERVLQLVDYVTQVDEAVEHWAAANGA